MNWSFDEWFLNFWNRYPPDLCHKRKGDKTKAYNAAKRKVTTEEEAKRVISNTIAWARYSRKERELNRYTDRWPMVSTFFNQKFYDREIPSLSDLENKFNKPKRKCECGRDTLGPNYDKCWEHHNAPEIKPEPVRKPVNVKSWAEEAKKILNKG